MKTVNGRIQYQVKDLAQDVGDFPPESVVFATYHDADGTYHRRPIYKTAETAEPGEVFLYLGKDVDLASDEFFRRGDENGD